MKQLKQYGIRYISDKGLQTRFVKAKDDTQAKKKHNKSKGVFVDVYLAQF